MKVGDPIKHPLSVYSTVYYPNKHQVLFLFIGIYLRYEWLLCPRIYRS